MEERWGDLDTSFEWASKVLALSARLLEGSPWEDSDIREGETKWEKVSRGWRMLLSNKGHQCVCIHAQATLMPMGKAT